MSFYKLTFNVQPTTTRNKLSSLGTDAKYMLLARRLAFCIQESRLRSIQGQVVIRPAQQVNSYFGGDVPLSGESMPFLVFTLEFFLC